MQHFLNTLSPSLSSTLSSPLFIYPFIYLFFSTVLPSEFQPVLQISQERTEGCYFQSSERQDVFLRQKKINKHSKKGQKKLSLSPSRFLPLSLPRLIRNDPPTPASRCCWLLFPEVRETQSTRNSCASRTMREMMRAIQEPFDRMKLFTQRYFSTSHSFIFDRHARRRHLSSSSQAEPTATLC